MCDIDNEGQRNVMFKQHHSRTFTVRAYVNKCIIEYLKKMYSDKFII